MSAFKFTVSELPGALSAALAGPLNFENSQSLQRSLTELSATHPKLVYLDLSGLTFLPSQAMGHLVQFRNGLKPFGSRIVLIATPPRILDSIRRAHLDKLFEFKDKVDVQPA